ncbi:hypothetical protein KIPB_004463, partial [Kipferlia bialata]|eukprot:g4463.t1
MDWVQARRRQDTGVHGQCDSFCHLRTCSASRARVLAEWGERDRERSIDDIEDTVIDNSGLCSHFERYLPRSAAKIPPGLYTLDRLRMMAQVDGHAVLCPYFYARRAVSEASVVVCSYSYILDPKVQASIHASLSSDCVVVFDEAHNVEQAALDAMSYHITRSTLAAARKDLAKLQSAVEKHRLSGDVARALSSLSFDVATQETLDAEDITRLADLVVHHSRLVQHVPTAQQLNTARQTEGQGGRDPSFPGSIAMAGHFLSVLRACLHALRVTIRNTPSMAGATPVLDHPRVFLTRLVAEAAVDPACLSYLVDRLQ